MPRRNPRSFLAAALISFGIIPFASTLSYATNENSAFFDDLSELSSTEPIGVYNHLHWHNLFIKNPDPDSEDEKHGGIYPKSPWGEGLQPQTTMACHDTLSSPLFGAARFSATYFGSRVALFDLQHFSFGCVELDPLTHKATNIPKACAVSVKGYSPGRSVDSFTGLQQLEGVKPSLEMTLWYTMTGDEEVTAETKMRMVRMAGLDRSWWALGAVTLEAVAEVPVLLCIDEVMYRTYNVTKWGQTFAPPEHDESL